MKAPATGPPPSAPPSCARSSRATPGRSWRCAAILRSLAPGYRLHRADLPGKPDIVYGRRAGDFRSRLLLARPRLPARRAHAEGRTPTIGGQKIARNRARDAKTVAALEAMGWRALAIFECALKDPAALRARLGAALA